MSSIRSWLGSQWIILKNEPLKWAFLVIAVVASVQLTQVGSRPALDWSIISIQIASALVLPGILAITVGAWNGAHDSRTQGENPAAATPYGSWTFPIQRLISIVLYAALSALIILTTALTWGVLASAWGSPEWILITAAVGYLLAIAAIGYAIGTLVRWPLIAPLVGFAWWLIDGAVATSSGPWQNAVPRALAENIGGGFWMELTPSSTPVNLIGLSIALIILGFATTVSVSMSTSVARFVWIPVAVLVLAGPLVLIHNAPSGPDYTERTARRVAPVCETRNDIELCVHPAHERYLADLRMIVEGIVGPVRSAMPATVVIEEWRLGVPDSSYWIDPYTFDQPDQLAWNLALQLAAGPDWEASAEITFPQAIVATWILETAGYGSSFNQPVHLTREMSSAVTPQQQANLIQEFEAQLASFSRIPDDQRLQWLRSSLDDLQAGTLSADALP